MRFERQRTIAICHKGVLVSALRTGLRRLTREHPKTFRPSDLPVHPKIDQETDPDAPGDS
jgi:hypothetical protein